MDGEDRPVGLKGLPDLVFVPEDAGLHAEDHMFPIRGELFQRVHQRDQVQDVLTILIAGRERLQENGVLDAEPRVGEELRREIRQHSRRAPTAPEEVERFEKRPDALCLFLGGKLCDKPPERRGQVLDRHTGI